MPSSDGYPGAAIYRSQAPPPSFTDRRVAAPKEAFDELRADANRLAAYDGDVFPKAKYRFVNFNSGDVSVHFQGIQRSPNQPIIFLSGGDPDESYRGSQLFVVRIESRNTNGPWGSNIVASGDPPDTDKVIGMFKLDEELWHAGGISLLGDILAVPLESSERSEIRFYDVSKPKAPTLLDGIIQRPGVGAAAVAICRLSTGHLLCGVWAENPLRTDFYVSSNSDLNQGFGDPMQCKFGAYEGVLEPSYQSIKFLQGNNGDSVFLLGTRSTSVGAPLTGAPEAHLFRVDLTDDPTLELCGTRSFGDDDHFDFGAGAGTYVGDDGRLLLYSVFHWRYDNKIRFGEFCPRYRR